MLGEIEGKGKRKKSLKIASNLQGGSTEIFERTVTWRSDIR